MVVPETVLAGTMRALTRLAGAFWLRTYKDPKLIATLSAERALQLAQLAADKEAGIARAWPKTCGAPDRMRWLPWAINADDWATVPLYAGDGAVAGSQPAGTAYHQSVVPVSGAGLRLAGKVCYPAPDIDGFAFVCDNPLNPTRVWTPPRTVELTRGVLVFPADDDPARDGNTVVWFCDAEKGDGGAYDTAGWPLGVGRGSGAGYVEALRTLWSLYTLGASKPAVSEFVAAAAGRPVSSHEGEIVEAVYTESPRAVVTNRAVYEFPAEAGEPAVDVGDVLPFGTSLDGSVFVFCGITPSQAARDKLAIIPVTIHGMTVAVTWDETDIIYRGLSANGHPLYSFAITGNSDTDTALWAQIWASSEVGHAVALDGHITDGSASVIGTVVGRISPADYFVREAVGASTVFVAAPACAVAPGLFEGLRSTVLAGARVAGTIAAGAGDDSYAGAGVVDSADVVEVVDKESTGAVAARGRLCYHDMVSMVYVPSCRE